jgi:DUF1680 family protein
LRTRIVHVLAAINGSKLINKEIAIMSSNLRNSRPIPLKNIKIKDNFWSKYVELVREVVIPYQWEALNDRVPDAEPSHAIKNFKIAAGLDEGSFYGMVFQDSDLAKWLEAVAYRLETHPDESLEKTADGVIDIIEKAQQRDGYLNTYFTIKEPGKRWTNLHECHELYCAGHIIEAATAYYQATGKRKLLEVVCRLADHIASVFGPEPEKKKGYPGHQVIELALVKLYHVTKDERYLKLGEYFIDERGNKPYYFDVEWEKRGKISHWSGGISNAPSKSSSYNQAHLPVRKQAVAEGHAVRAVYMYSGMADVAAETGDKELLEACRTLWNNIVSRQMYITGGIGSTAHGEAFTFDYDLPNDTAYSETCASIGLMFFAQRMLQIEAKSSYADVMERALYNTVISGMSQDGKKFFYVNPLEVLPKACEKSPIKTHVKPTRQKWFGCACCPPNIARVLTSLGHYIYTANEDTIYTHLYIGGEAEAELRGNKIKIVQATEYPWDEKVAMKIFSAEEREFNIALRIPGWCSKVKVMINGEAVAVDDKLKDGYAIIKWVWKNEDTIELVFEMPVLRVKANPLVRENIGKVALSRGPIVYCMEEADNGANLQEIVLPRNAELKAETDNELLAGTVVINAEAERVSHAEWGEDLYKANVETISCPEKVKFIPYYAWANRNVGEMAVWVREK